MKKLGFWNKINAPTVTKLSVQPSKHNSYKQPWIFLITVLLEAISKVNFT